MGTEEIRTAYPLLVRQWVERNKGYALRTGRAQRGYPDYLLSHRSTGTIMTEVKCVNAPSDFIGLDYHQAKMLDELDIYGTRVRVVCYCLLKSVWGIFMPQYSSVYKLLRFSMADVYTPELRPEVMMQGELEGSSRRGSYVLARGGNERECGKESISCTQK